MNRDTDQWTSLNNDNTPIFNYQYFERGYTDVKVLKVTNLGDVSFKWQARIIFRGVRSELSDVINVYVLKSDTELAYPTQRSEVDAWGEPVTLTYFIDHIAEILTGTLEADETAYFALALQMQKDAPDRYLNLTLGEFDIQIATIQATVESDFFGTEYDDTITFPCAHTKTTVVVDRDATLEQRGQQRTVCANPECGVTLKSEDIYLIYEIKESGNYVVGFTKDLTLDDGTEYTDVVVPATYKNVTVAVIGRDAFMGNTKITKITIPQDVRYIDYDAFKGCTSLKNVEFLGESKLSAIGNYTFQNCENLQKIAIPAGVTQIGQRTFEGCKNLQSVTFADNNALETVDLYAFRDCDSLQSVYFGKNSVLTYINLGAFRYCDNLQSITIPKGVTQICGYTFEDCRALETVILENADNIRSIGERAFYNCSELVNFEIPSNVTSIGAYAFYGCSSLTKITIPRGITNISEGTFWGCILVPSITIPGSVKTIGTYAFASCDLIEEIIIPDSVTYIGAYAFFGCENLSKVELPSTITTISYGMFQACTNLKEIEIPYGVASIDVSAFGGCKNLLKVDIPDSVTSIGETAFKDCSALREIDIPASVTSIGYQAFYLSGVTEVTFGNTVGWWCSKEANATSGTSLLAEDLADSSKAASYLRQYSYYCRYYWYCTVSE